jgi:hypothetical protein
VVDSQWHAPADLPPGKKLALIVEKTGWSTGHIWMGPENLSSTGVRTSYHLACSKSLYHLQYSGWPNIQYFWDMPCQTGNFLGLLGPEDGGSIFLWNWKVYQSSWHRTAREQNFISTAVTTENLATDLFGCCRITWGRNGGDDNLQLELLWFTDLKLNICYFWKNGL